ncbi:MAG: 30S ribosomal protein S3 [candidate division Zixibacteria bacterium SM23_81]|nr:MAG: 30S ribosomal protein S3 [candidate division Zixibacteria bacterium SM23_81]
MGQKTNPVGLRLGINKTWDSRWFSIPKYAELLQEDFTIRNYIKNRLQRAGVAKVEIQRAPKRITIDIHTARPGIVIGRRGIEVERLKEELQHLTKKDIYINIQEIKRPELDAYLVAESVARQLEQRVSFRRALKKTVSSTMRMGAQGIRIACSGRLGGAEMARRAQYHEGRVPLHTLRADIDFARVTAQTTYGCIGVKVWICKGEVLSKEDTQEPGSVPGRKRGSGGRKAVKGGRGRPQER